MKSRIFLYLFVFATKKDFHLIFLQIFLLHLELSKEFDYFYYNYLKIFLTNSKILELLQLENPLCIKNILQYKSKETKLTLVIASKNLLSSREKYEAIDPLYLLRRVFYETLTIWREKNTSQWEDIQ